MRDLSMHIMDIIQNSITAEATLIELEITDSKKENLYKIKFKDNGKGMSEEVLKNVSDPFFTTRTTRKVGLGISLLKQNAEQTGGKLDITSKLGIGTIVEVDFKNNHFDRPTEGDIAGTVSILAASNPDIDFVYHHITDYGDYVFDTKEVKEVLGEVNISDIRLVKYIKEMIQENVNEISLLSEC